MKNHFDYVTHIKNKEDVIYLRSKHFPVNMRLFHTSPEYKAIILQQCQYIRQNCLEVKEGYKKPHGMSSANLGLSFNIIGVTQNRGTNNEVCKIFINPIINSYHGDVVETITNCGSLTLDKSLKIKRHEIINITYYDEEGNIWRHDVTREFGSLTIQHEVDHNLGILITDYKQI